MNEHKVGDSIYLGHAMFLKTRGQALGESLPKVGEIVKTKYGPQISGIVTGVKMGGLFIKIIEIDDSKKGHYSEWPEYKRIVENQYLTDGEKAERIIEEIL